MTPETLEDTMRLGVLTTRSLPVTPDTYDEKTRSVEVVLATDDPVEVFDWENMEIVREVLLMDGVQLPDNRQVPLLDSHNRWSLSSVIGSLRDFKTENGQLIARAYFSDDEDGKRAEAKVRGGHVTDMSAGYRVEEKEKIGKDETRKIGSKEFKGPMRISTKWRLREGSLTAIGADEKTKVRSTAITDETRKILVERGLSENASHEETVKFLNDQLKSNNSQNRGETTMSENKDKNNGTPPADNTRHEVDINQVREKARKDEAERISGIHATADQFAEQVPGMRDLANQAIKEDWDIARLNAEVLKRISTSSPVDTDRDDGDSGKIGMTEKEIKRYSIVRAMRQLVDGDKLDGIEKEASVAMQKLTGRNLSSRGFTIPDDVLCYQSDIKISDDLARALMANRPELSRMQSRAVTDAMTPTLFDHGGAFIGTEVLGANMIEMLRNMPLVAEMGARRLSGLVGNVAIPKQTGGATGYWLAAGASITKSRQTVSQVPLTPKRLAAQTYYDKQLLFQSSVGVEQFVRTDLMSVLAIERDRAALFGSGADGQPLGIFNVSGVNSVTFGAAATWAKVVEFETKVAEDNALRGSRGYMTSPGVKGKWKTTVKVTNQAVFLWENGDIVNGYRAAATNQIPSSGDYAHRVVFGNWNDYLLADWAGIDVVVDPFSAAGEGEIRIVITLWVDQALRHPESMAISADSGAQ